MRRAQLFACIAAAMLSMGQRSYVPGERSLEGGEVVSAASVRAGMRLVEAKILTGHRMDKRCLADDAYILKILVGGEDIYSEDYCSTNGPHQAVELHQDVTGTPFVFVRYAAGHGTNAMSLGVKVYSAKSHVRQEGEFATMMPATATDVIRYAYDVSAPAGGGLDVSTRVIHWPADPGDCCDTIPKTERFHFPTGP